MFRYNNYLIFIYYIIITTFCFAARDPPIITIPNQGIILGKEVSRSRVQKIIGYYGIPYAKPPIDKLRFQPPNYLEPPQWDGIRNATDYQPACLQHKNDFTEESLPFLQLITDMNFNQSEDCLYLNVFVPYGSPAVDGFATIVWLHPGNFSSGSASIWNPHTLVYRHRIIVVTVSWRLNIMGFLTTMDGEAPGNYGLMDQQAAMRWIKNNIQLFGGNPNNICLMGYGTGGVSVGLHMINKVSQEFFHKAIIMSGNFLNPSTIKDIKEHKIILDKLAESFGCIRQPTSQLIDCLQSVEGETLVEVAASLNINWRPIIDEGLSNSTSGFLTDYPKTYFESDDFYKIPFLTGYTNMEEILKYQQNLKTDSNRTRDELQQILKDILNSDIPTTNTTNDNCIYNYDHISDAINFFYGPNNLQNINELRKIISEFTTEKYYASSIFLQASYLSQQQQPTFVYRFDMKPITKWVVETLPDWVGLPHLFDLVYVWGIPYWSEQEPGNSWELRDKRISDIIMSFWTNFAKSSDPTEGTLYPIKWEQFTSDSPGILIIDNTFNMSNTKTLNYKAFEFWNQYYPKVVEIASQCCTSTDQAYQLFRLKNIFLLQLLLITILYLII